MVSEAVAFKLATSCAKLLYRAWAVKNRPTFGTVGDFDKLLIRNHSLPFEQQRVRYRLSEIGNQLREKLRPVLEHEYGGLAENEAEAAALAVSDALHTLPLSGATLLSIDLDPGKLESLITEQEVFRKDVAQLDSAGAAYAKRLIRDICNYLIDIVISLPDFTSNAAVELLSRDSELKALIQRVLSEIPTLDPARLAATADDDFQVRYMTYVARTLDWLRLFGLDQAGGDSRYGLSIAYITLTAERINSSPTDALALALAKQTSAADILNMSRHGTTESNALTLEAFLQIDSDLVPEMLPTANALQIRSWRGGVEGASGRRIRNYSGLSIMSDGKISMPEVWETLLSITIDGERLSVDEMVATRHRILIQGGAGSGKTTLLQWLAVQAAKATFQAPLDAWNGLIPFFLQLRRMKDGLPSPGEFLNAAASNLKDGMPPGWVNRVLESGNALLLIDGVDEVPPKIRVQLRQWIAEIHDSFPEIKVIITSRPTAVDEGWLDTLSYSVFRLESLTMPDIVEFVHHWFRAARVSDEHPTDLEVTRDDLIARISNQPALRQLATTPLLCAMLCALSKSRRGFVPNDRMELYRVALEMLLERRDLERQVEDEGPLLSLRQKLAILQAISWWFQLSNRSEATFAEVDAVIARALPLLQGVTADSEQILRQLILRSGVLREPGLDTVDFVHKTFQEYLAAQFAIQDDLVDALIEHAHSDNWREVIIMAAGHAVSPKQCDRLIRGLLHKGTDQPRHRHQYYLLAVASLETALQVTPQLRSDVESALRELVPPRNIKAARELAAAGEAAIPHLDVSMAEKRITAPKAVATVRCLAMIGGEEALRVLATRFGTDARITVVRELLRSWPQFDPESFARLVLAQSPLEHGVLRLQNPRLLEHTALLQKLTDIMLQVPGGSADLGMILKYPKISDLMLGNEPGINDITGLSSMPILRRLRLHNVAIRSLPRQLPPQLRILQLSNCSKLHTLRGLDSVHLERLSIASCPNLKHHLGDTNVDELQTAYLSDVGELDPTFLVEAKKLFVLSMIANGKSAIERSQDFIGELASLRILSISDKIGPLPDFKRLSNLTALTLNITSEVLPVLPLGLHHLVLRGGAVSDVSSLAGCSGLLHISLQGTLSLSNLDVLGVLPNLRSVSLYGTPLIDVPALRERLPGVSIHDDF